MRVPVRLSAVATILASLAAGCGQTTTPSATTEPAVHPAPPSDGYVFVMNTGSDTISVIDPKTNTVIKTLSAQGMTLSPYPSDQYAPGSGYVLSGWKNTLSILKVSGTSVSLVKNIPLPPSVTTKNGTPVPQTGVWGDITPSGTGVVAVREAEKYLFLNMNPHSKTFGQVEYSIDTAQLGPHGTGIGP
jgi:YVTN family beta-propeller protein